LIGGATTSDKHTAVKIAPHYQHGVVHVLDASRCVGVVDQLMNRDSKNKFLAANAALQNRLTSEYQERQMTLVPYQEALANRLVTDWDNIDIAVPSFVGTLTIGTVGPRVVTGAWAHAKFPITQQSSPVVEPQSGQHVTHNLWPIPGMEITLAEIAEYIDWSPFFSAWELHGKYPAILKDPIVGFEARRVFKDAQSLLADIIQHQLLTARGVFGFWPANSDGDTVIVYADTTRQTEIARFEMLRQQWQRKGIAHYRSLADYIAPIGSGRQDYLGGFAVTAGHGCDELVKKFRDRHDDYSAIMVSALADRLAEAFAELLHKIARRHWGFGDRETLSMDDLIKEKYRGIRPAAGYPACPDHTEKGTLWRLLNVPAAAEIRLTESYAMWPGASVSGLYFAHPQSRYFSVNKITRDQVEHYARRKGQSIEETEKWLSPILGY